MAELSQKSRLIALAKLVNGTTPKDVSEEMDDISYGQAIKLSKELKRAQEKNDLEQLFRMPEDSREMLFAAVRDSLEADLGGLVPTTTLEGELLSLDEKVTGLAMLDGELQKSALTIARRINILASANADVSSLSILTDSLAKLQTAFFAKGTNVQVNNYNETRFGSLLRD